MPHADTCRHCSRYIEHRAEGWLHTDGVHTDPAHGWRSCWPDGSNPLTDDPQHAAP